MFEKAGHTAKLITNFHNKCSVFIVSDDILTRHTHRQGEDAVPVRALVDGTERLPRKGV